MRTGAVKSLISDVAQVTPAWLTTVLYEQGCLSHGEVVTVQKESPYFSDMSVLSRLTLGYSPGATASAPSRPLLKIPLPEPDWMVTPSLGRKEVDFYVNAASAMSHPPAVRCYEALYCPQSDRSHVLIDDLSATHSRPEFPLPPLNRHCDQLIDCVARLHAFWWNHPRLGDDIGAFPDDEFVRRHYQKIEEGWGGFCRLSRRPAVARAARPVRKGPVVLADVVASAPRSLRQYRQHHPDSWRPPRLERSVSRFSTRRRCLSH